MKWWSGRSYAVKVYVRAAVIITAIAAVILGTWAHAEIESIKRTGYKRCVHANFTFQPDSPSKLTAEAKLAMCEQDAPTMVDLMIGDDPP
jgi:hypothetical protein